MRDEDQICPRVENFSKMTKINHRSLTIPDSNLGRFNYYLGQIFNIRLIIVGSDGNLLRKT